MTHDILIKGGRVVDGTGSSAKYADVAIKDGIIVEIGKTDGQAEQEIDALNKENKEYKWKYFFFK